MDIVRHPGEDLFFEAILSLRTVEDCRLFFEDVATIKELQAMSQRFRVACLLDSGENYIEVSESTGASSATISRVNRCLALWRRLPDGAGQAQGIGSPPGRRRKIKQGTPLGSPSGRAVTEGD